jgi:hypothetical protein
VCQPPGTMPEWLGWIIIILVGNLMSIGVNHRFLVNTDALCGPGPGWLDFYGEHSVCVQKERATLALIRTIGLDCVLATVCGLWYACAEKCVCKRVWDRVRNGMPRADFEVSMPKMDTEKWLVCVTCFPLCVLSMMQHVPWARWLALAGVFWTLMNDAGRLVLKHKQIGRFTVHSKEECKKQPMLQNALMLMGLAVVVSNSPSAFLSVITDARVEQINSDLKEFVCPNITKGEARQYFAASSVTRTVGHAQSMLVQPIVGEPLQILRTHVRKYIWEHAWLSAWCNTVCFSFFLSVMVLSNNKTEMFDACGKVVKGAWECGEWMWDLIELIGKGIKYIIASLTLVVGVSWFAHASAFTVLLDWFCYGLSIIAWFLHSILYWVAFLHWLDDHDKMSIVLATSAGWLVLFMLRYHNWLVLFWAWVLVAHDSKEAWSPVQYVQACTYWTRASVLFCCVVQLLSMLAEVVTLKDAPQYFFVKLTTGWY